MSAEKIGRLRQIRAERLQLQRRIAVLNAEAADLGQLICCAACRKEGYFPAPGGEENLPQGWVMATCDDGHCINCWAYWCPEHSSERAQFECPRRD